MSAPVMLELLDSAHGHPLQSWYFKGEARITVGRAPDNDVAVSDPFVSRAHAYLQYERDGWHVIAISAQQLMHNGQKQPEVTLKDGSLFRLGPSGCHLRIHYGAESSGVLKTLSFEPTMVPVLQLDHQRLAREVNEIATSDYFQHLKQAADKLRRRPR